MKQVTVDAFKEVVEAEKANPSVDFINVCTPAEYNEKYIPGVRNIPLDELDRHLEDLKTKKTIYLHCISGGRGRKAVDKLANLGLEAELVNVEGGLDAWAAAGFATASNTTRMPIMRQVMLTAGSLIVLGWALSIMVNPHFIYMSVFVGAGLTFSGLTGYCGMSYFLARMPWNR